MPTRILVWNIETFGCRGLAGEIIRCQAIANIARDANADVLVLQELRSQGVARLDNLRRELNLAYKDVVGPNPSWHFDWVKGAVTNAGAIPPVSAADLGFTCGGNKEGYAVFFRDGTLSGLAGNPLSAGLDDAGAAAPHYISLVTSGVEPHLNFDNPALPRLQFPSAPLHPIPTPMVPFPTSGSPAIQRPPDRDPADRAAKRARLADPLEDVLFPRLARRPCFIVLPPAGARPAYTIVVYHAPVASQGNYYGTSMGFMVDELRGGDCAYAGDYNILKVGDRAKVSAMATHLGFTQNAQNPPGTYIPTMVHAIRDGVWRQGARVLTNARDLGFGKAGFCNISVYGDARNFDVRTKIGGYLRRNMDDIKKLILMSFCKKLPATARTILNNYPGPSIYPWGTDQETAKALLYFLLVSDHLPILITVGP